MWRAGACGKLVVVVLLMLLVLVLTLEMKGVQAIGTECRAEAWYCASVQLCKENHDYIREVDLVIADLLFSPRYVIDIWDEKICCRY